MKKVCRLLVWRRSRPFAATRLIPGANRAIRYAMRSTNPTRRLGARP
jgi:hypothetical protein